MFDFTFYMTFDDLPSDKFHKSQVKNVNYVKKQMEGVFNVGVVHQCSSIGEMCVNTSLFNAEPSKFKTFF